MKRILLVDDDQLILRVYKQGLTQRNFSVETAADGLMAVQSLRASKPDLVVLDLMMPKFSGADVLKFLREQPDLSSLPVVVLSNSYMNELGDRASTYGVEKALLKVGCTPSVLAEVIGQILAGRDSLQDPSKLLAVSAGRSERRAEQPATKLPERSSSGAKAPSTPPADSPPVASAGQMSSEADAALKIKTRKEFLHSGPQTCKTLRDLCRAFTNAASDAEKSVRLEALYRKVHFISAGAGLAECHFIAQMASAFEALLFELLAKPVFITPSTVRTIVSTVDFLVLLFGHARESGGVVLSGLTLVVDDDPLSNRLVVAGLHRAQLAAHSTESPIGALRQVLERTYELLLLDIEMPEMGGFELCKRIRAMPQYHRTPIIYVTSHNDFETRAKSLISGADDLIAKPVFPLELVVKVVGHLLRKQLPHA